MAAIQRIPLHRILLPVNLPAGLSLWTLIAVAHPLRNAGHDVTDPVTVRPLGPDLWQLVDGRHRFAASLLAGCKDILAIEET